jgi:hypothetical protein
MGMPAKVGSMPTVRGRESGPAMPLWHAMGYPGRQRDLGSAHSATMAERSDIRHLRHET